MDFQPFSKPSSSMPLSDEEFLADLHRRLGEAYGEKSVLQRINNQLGEQVKALGTQLAALEQEKDNVRSALATHQTTVLELRAQLERLSREKTDEIAHLQALYDVPITENEHRKAEFDRLTTEQERILKENQTRLQQCYALQQAMESLSQSGVEKDGMIKIGSEHISQLQDEKLALTKQIETYRAQVERLQNAHNTNEKSNAEFVQQITEENSQLKGRIEKLISEALQQENALTEQQSFSVAQSSEILKLNQTVATLSSEREDTTAKLSQASLELERLRVDRDTVDSLFDEYYEKFNSQEELLAQQKTELDEALHNNNALTSEVMMLRTQNTSLQAELVSARRGATVDHVDKAVQVKPVTVDVAIQTTTSETRVPYQQSTTTTAVQSTARSESAVSRSSASRTRRNNTTTRPLLVAKDAELPLARRQMVETFAAVALSPSAGAETAVFNRPYLSSALGGGMQGVVGTFDTKKPRKPLSVKFDLLGCLYPQRHLNPWLPQVPGTHGFLFLGLVGPGKDHERFLAPVERALFIHESVGWRYYGQYLVERNPERDLSMEEWNALSDEFKDGDNGYCAMTLNKRMGGSKYQMFKDSHKIQHDEEVRAVRAYYDAGELRVPCISLQCVGYLDGLIEDLKYGPVSLEKETQSAQKRKRRVLEDAENIEGVADANSDTPRPATRARVTLRLPTTSIDLA